MGLPTLLQGLRNPILSSAGTLRDPALLFHDGLFHLFLTEMDQQAKPFPLWYVTQRTTRDFRSWSPSVRISPAGYASPGNAIRVGAEWWLCVQSYRLAEGERWPGDGCRLFWLKSRDLVRWSEPAVIMPDGTPSPWAAGRRQIDPFVLEHPGHGGRWHLFYKASAAGKGGCLARAVSDDLVTWRDGCPDRPALWADDLPDRMTVENPCVVAGPDGIFHFYFSPCRSGRGLGQATSANLLRWQVEPEIPARLDWAPGGPTAHVLVPLAPSGEGWLMLFHGESGPDDGHRQERARIGFGWSPDLETWEIP